MVKKPGLLPPVLPAEARETPVKPLVELIAAWRQDDGQGYDVATDLLHEAEGLLRRLFETGGYCVRCGEPWTAHHWQPNTYVCRDKASALPAPDLAVTPPTTIEALQAYGEHESTQALHEKRRDDYQFWQGWNAVLQRIAKPREAGADRAVTAPQEQESTPVIAAGLLTLLKEECEAQHTRAEKAESELKALRAALLVLVGEMSDVVEDLNDKAFLAHFAAKLQRLLEAEAQLADMRALALQGDLKSARALLESNGYEVRRKDLEQL